MFSFVFSYYPFSYHSIGGTKQTYTAKFGCFKYGFNPDGSGTDSWFKYSCAATGTNDVVLTEHSAAGCADDTKTVFAKNNAGDADVKKFTYTNIFQDFAIPDGGGWTTKQERKAISYCKDGTSTPPPRAKCSSISGPLAWCKTADAKKFTNGLISDDKGVPVVGLICKADPCVPADDGATCCEDMTPKDSGKPAKCSSISGPLQWCKISDAKKFTNGLISDDKGIPIDTNCKADPCTNKDDGATCCEDMTKKESLGTGTGPSSASESDGTKVTLGMMSTALSALAVVYATTY